MTSAHPALVDGPVYLDYNATTPVDPRVAEAMQPYLTSHFGNPSSAHTYATTPAHALRRSREQVAALVGATPDGIVFTGSGSEANNFAIRGTVLAAETSRPHVITQATEHPAVLATCQALQRLRGAAITHLPVDRHGLVDPDDLAAAITPHTVLVSIMLANNETGTIQPIAELARIAHDHGVLLHTDAAQAAGKIPIDVAALGADLLTVVGHQMYARKGIAALYARPGLNLEPVVYGGRQERGLRAGTENVAFAVALGAAADLARADLAAGGRQRLNHLRDRLHRGVADALPGQVALNGHADRRLPNTLNLSITGVTGDQLLAAAPVSRPPPVRPATPGQPNPHRCSRRWALTTSTPCPRSDSAWDDGAPRPMSTKPPTCSPQQPEVFFTFGSAPPHDGAAPPLSHDRDDLIGPQRPLGQLVQYGAAGARCPSSGAGRCRPVRV